MRRIGGPSVLGLLAAMLLAGCGLAGATTPVDVGLVVSDGFGSRALQFTGAPKVLASETVLALLMRNDHVGTRAGGRTVQSIDGVSGGHENGDPVDWFYYVNGIQAPLGPAATHLHPGDRVWWDRHDWSVTDQVPAVVGSYPQPFLNGSGGNRYPVTVICVDPRDDACHTVTANLRAQGVPVALGALGTDEPQTLRVLVGPWLALRGDPAASYLQSGPQRSGVYVRFAPDGSALSLLDPRGAVRRTLTAATGLVAATRIPEEVPTWLVTGTDAAGVDAAAHALNASSLHDHFALALSGAVPLAVPFGM